MIIRDRKRIASIKHKLLDSLKKEHAFWSYEQESVTLSNIDDSQLSCPLMEDDVFAETPAYVFAVTHHLGLDNLARNAGGRLGGN